MIFYWIRFDESLGGKVKWNDIIFNDYGYCWGIVLRNKIVEKGEFEIVEDNCFEFVFCLFFLLLEKIKGIIL